METLARARTEIRAATEGRVRLRLYPSGIMGEERDVLFKIRARQLDGGGFMGAGIARICPDAQALMLPVLFDSHEEADAVLAGMSDFLARQSRENGFVALGWTEVGFAYLLSTVPVRGLADLRGARPWATSEEGMLRDFFSAARVHAIPVPVTDVLTALQTGSIQTVFSPPLGAVAMQWHTRVRYRNDMPLSYSFGGVFVAERSWRRIAEEDRDVIHEIFGRLTSELTRTVRERNQEALEVMEAQGVETLSSSPEEREAFVSISRETVNNLVGRVFSEEAWTRMQRILGDMRDSNAGSVE